MQSVPFGWFIVKKSSVIWLSNNNNATLWTKQQLNNMSTTSTTKFLRMESYLATNFIPDWLFDLISRLFIFILFDNLFVQPWIVSIISMRFDKVFVAWLIFLLIFIFFSILTYIHEIIQANVRFSMHANLWQYSNHHNTYVLEVIFS